MPIPDYQTIMLPLLQFASDGKVHVVRDATNALADYFQLTDKELDELIPSGTQGVFHNRVNWANTYLKKAGLLVAPQRGRFQITERGYQVLQQNPDRIDNQFLKQFESFVEFRSRTTKEETTSETVSDTEESTPQESIDLAYRTIRAEVETEILESIMSCSPAFFERLVVNLLVKMGYGGTRQEAGRAIGRSGDGGIDGTIDQDRLGLDVIYLQAKRWEGSVGRPEIQKFAGALQGKRAKKGIFITTSRFTSEAQEYADFIDNRIILIDGDRLAAFMFNYNLGVSIVESYELKRVDSDYFVE